MAGLLKFVVFVGLLGCLVWFGAIALNHIGGAAGVQQAATATSPSGLGQAVQGAEERAAQTINCASSGRTAC